MDNKRRPEPRQNAVADELNDVLGRFTAWTATQRGTKTPHPDPSHHPDPSSPGAPGARELSYEEALGASRFRTRQSKSLINPAPQENEPVAASIGGRLPNAHAEPKPKSPTVAPPKVQTPSPRLPRRKASARTKEPVAVPAKPGHQKARSATCSVAPGKARPTRPAHVPGKALKFREVLDASLSNAGRAAVNPDKSVWLTLRVTASEQSQIQARAAEAELSVSAYLRQCAFEVESHREPVQRTLLDLQTSPGTLPTPAPEDLASVSPAAHSGILTGISQRVSRLFGRSPRFSTTA